MLPGTYVATYISALSGNRVRLRHLPASPHSRAPKAQHTRFCALRGVRCERGCGDAEEGQALGTHSFRTGFADARSDVERSREMRLCLATEVDAAAELRLMKTVEQNLARICELMQISFCFVPSLPQPLWWVEAMLGSTCYLC